MRDLILGIAFALTPVPGLLAQWMTSGSNIYNSNSGNVGIGNSSPAQKLDISAGNIVLDNNYAFMARQVSGQVTNLLKYDNTNTAIVGPNAEIRLNGSTTLLSPSGGHIYIIGGDIDGSTAIGTTFNTVNNFATLGAKLVSFKNANTEEAYIDKDGGAYFNGNFGIGVATPNAKLDVNGNIYSNGKIYIGVSDANTSTNMGTNLLAVNGTALFNKVTVRAPLWPDYVFSPTYKITPLDSLEQFIFLNKHLPEVSSATDVEKNGIDLGDNQALLLKKIEELTLIVIEQNKRIEKLEKRKEIIL